MCFILLLFYYQDIENYKTVVKAKIGNWQKHLMGQKSDDWVIIHVFYQDNSKPAKSKLQLPRSSVFDKIKSDFAQGRQDRCVLTKILHNFQLRNRMILTYVFFFN